MLSNSDKIQTATIKDIFLALKVFFALWFFQSWWRWEISKLSFFFFCKFCPSLLFFFTLFPLSSLYSFISCHFSLRSCADGSVVFYPSLNFLQAVNRSFSEYLCLIINTLYPVILAKHNTFPLYFKALNFCIALRIVHYNLAKFVICIHQLLHPTDQFQNFICLNFVYIRHKLSL